MTTPPTIEKRILRHSRGFTLLETLFAMVILAIALLGAFASFMHISRELREAQLRQYKTLLAQASIERQKLADRSSLFPGVTANPGDVRVELWDLNYGGWTMDPSAPVQDDLGTGSLFVISPTGRIDRQTAAVTGCDDTSIPDGTYCREILVHRDVPGTPLNNPIRTSFPGIRSSAVTVWVRVIRKGEPVRAAAVQAQVMVQ